MDHLTDLALIQRNEDGDPRAFDVLIRRYLPRIYGFHVRITRDPQTAEDLTQETFLKAWRRLRTFRQQYDFAPWLFTIAKRTALDELRKRKRESVHRVELTEEAQELLQNCRDPRPLPDEQAEHQERVKQIQTELTSLPSHTRSILLWYGVEHRTFREIALHMQASINTVKSRYRRAILSLRKKLND